MANYSLRFPYEEQDSVVLGKTKRPIMKLYIFSERFKFWLPIKNVLVDSGADVSILPRDIGYNLVSNIVAGKRVNIKGIIPSYRLAGFLHELKLKVGEKEFLAPVVIVDTDLINPIFGREKAMDLFSIRFDKGKETILE